MRHRRRSGSDPAARRIPLKPASASFLPEHYGSGKAPGPKDRMSMAAVLDVQVPSCDHRAYAVREYTLADEKQFSSSRGKKRTA